MFFHIGDLGDRGWTDDLIFQLLRDPDFCNFANPLAFGYFRSSRVIEAENTRAFKKATRHFATGKARLKMDAAELEMKQKEFDSISNGELTLACHGGVIEYDRLTQEADFFYIKFFEPNHVPTNEEPIRSFVSVFYLRALFMYRIFTLHKAIGFPKDFDHDDCVFKLIGSQYPILLPRLEESFRLTKPGAKAKTRNRLRGARLVGTQSQS